MEKKVILPADLEATRQVSVAYAKMFIVLHVSKQLFLKTLKSHEGVLYLCNSEEWFVELRTRLEEYYEDPSQQSFDKVVEYIKSNFSARWRRLVGCCQRLSEGSLTFDKDLLLAALTAALSAADVMNIPQHEREALKLLGQSALKKHFE
ncbi:hypothetical protein EOM81_11430 [bacterium]|nr:hypothetical protein [bacterium]